MKTDITYPVIALCLIFANASAAALPEASQSKADAGMGQLAQAHAMKDIKVVVTVKDMADDLPIDIRNLERFRTDIQADIVLSLQKSGFKIGSSVSPILKIVIMLLETDSHASVFHVSIDLIDAQRPDNSRSLITAEAKWIEGQNFIVDKMPLRDIRDTIVKYVESFIKERLVTH